MLFVKKIIMSGKSEQELPWTQPVLSANGTIGGDSFACAVSSVNGSNYNGWKAFNGVKSQSDFWRATNSFPSWIEWYNPQPLKISNLEICSGAYSGYSYMCIADFYVEVSDNGSDWTNIKTVNNRVSGNPYSTINVPITEEIAHKYWRLYLLNSGSGEGSKITTLNTNYAARIIEITITATQIV